MRNYRKQQNKEMMVTNQTSEPAQNNNYTTLDNVQTLQRLRHKNHMILHVYRKHFR